MSEVAGAQTDDVEDEELHGVTGRRRPALHPPTIAPAIPGANLVDRSGRYPIGSRRLRAIVAAMLLRVALLFVPLLASCTSIEADIESSVAPAFAAARFSKLCVSTPENDLRARRAVEHEVARRLEPKGVTVIQLGKLLFPGEEHTEEEVRAAVRDCGADAFLTIVPLQTWTDERYVPPSVTTSTNYGRSGHPYGWGYSTTWVSGGYTISQPRATFDIRLLDVATEDVAWVATVGVRGTSDSSWTDLRTAAAAKAVEQMLKDGILATVKPDPER